MFDEKTKSKILLSPLLLAFLGDSVHTLFVRKQLAEQFESVGKLSSNCAKLCKASAQAQALKNLMPSLTEDEAEIVRKARNCKSKHPAKNASSADYSFATAFEALIGYLFLTEQTARLNEILQKSVISGENHAN